MEQTQAPGQHARQAEITRPSSVAAPPTVPGEPRTLSPVRAADEREDEERRRALVTLGLEVALALALTVASRVWAWVREERARARVNRELRRRLPAT